MNSYFTIRSDEDTVRHWWLSLILGILFLCISLFLLFSPRGGYGALVVLFSISMLLGGIAEIIFSVVNRHSLQGWGWYLAGGMLGLILGIFLVASPLVTAAIIPYVLAFWIMFGGISGIAFSIQLQGAKVNTWGWYLAFGILAIILSFIIIWNPFTGVVMSLFFVAISFMLMGINRIMMAIELKNIHKHLKRLE